MTSPSVFTPRAGITPAAGWRSPVVLKLLLTVSSYRAQRARSMPPTGSGAGSGESGSSAIEAGRLRQGC